MKIRSKYGVNTDIYGNILHRASPFTGIGSSVETAETSRHSTWNAIAKASPKKLLRGGSDKSWADKDTNRPVLCGEEALKSKHTSKATQKRGVAVSGSQGVRIQRSRLIG